MYPQVWRRIIDDVSLYPRFFEPIMNVLWRDGCALDIWYQYCISTQTAVSAPPDPTSEWNSRGHGGKSFWDDHQRSWKALRSAWSESLWQYPLKRWVEDGIVHTDSPVSRKSRMWVVISEERMVLKNKIIFAHVCTWNEFIQSQATFLPNVKQIEAKLPSQSNT